MFSRGVEARMNGFLMPRLIESAYIPEGFMVFDCGKKIMVVTPTGKALEFDKPSIIAPQTRTWGLDGQR